AGALANVSVESLHGWTFWSGTVDGYPVVISKTLKGMANAAAATALAAERYHPVAIINQGTAGGHVPDLHVYDIVLGTQAVNLGSFKTGYRVRGQGSEVAEWSPLDLMRSDGSAGQDPNARTMRRFAGDQNLLAAAHNARGEDRRHEIGVGKRRELFHRDLAKVGHVGIDEQGTAAWIEPRQIERQQIAVSEQATTVVDHKVAKVSMDRIDQGSGQCPETDVGT